MKTTTGKAAEKEMASMEREAKSDGSGDKEGVLTPDRQGRKEGGTPDYEKGQSNQSLDKEFKESNWT